MLLGHPVYENETLVEQGTHALIDSGHTIFQLWMLDPDERIHSLKVLTALQLEIDDEETYRIASLGCGVGGMERYWLGEHGNLKFDMVNQSKAQLEICWDKFPFDKEFGDRMVHSKAEYFTPKQNPYCTVLAYVLGHIEYKEDLLRKVIEYTTGPILVLDVVNTSMAFNNCMFYSTVDKSMLDGLGFKEVTHTNWHLNPVAAGENDPVINTSRPYMGIYRHA